MKKTELLNIIENELGLYIYLEKDRDEEDSLVNLILTENQVVLAQNKFELFTLPNYYNYLSKITDQGEKVSKKDMQEMLLLDLGFMFSTLINSLDEFLTENNITQGNTKEEEEFYRGQKKFYRAAKNLVETFISAIPEEYTEKLINLLSELINTQSEKE